MEMVGGWQLFEQNFLQRWSAFLTCMCALWSEGMIGCYIAQYVLNSDRKLSQKNQTCNATGRGHLNHRVTFKWCNVSHIMSTFKLYNKNEILWEKYFICVLFTLTIETRKWITHILTFVKLSSVYTFEYSFTKILEMKKANVIHYFIRARATL